MRRNKKRVSLKKKKKTIQRTRKHSKKLKMMANMIKLKTNAEDKFEVNSLKLD